MQPIMLSMYVTLAQACASQTATRKGIDNTPTPEVLKALRITARKVYDPLHVASQGRIRINSFYRSPLLNKAIGGSKTSQHVTGQAIDLDATDGLTNGELYRLVKKTLPEWDQLIWEYGDDKNPAWVHVSYRAGANRKMELRIG